MSVAAQSSALVLSGTRFTRQKSYRADVASRSGSTSSMSTTFITTAKWRSSTSRKRTRVSTPSRPSEQTTAGKSSSPRAIRRSTARPVVASTVTSSTHSSSS